MSRTDEQPLSSRLRAETRQAHQDAERSRFMARFLRGGVGQEAYIGYLASLLPLYEALESAWPDQPEWLRAIHPKGVLRADALRRDLDHLHEGVDDPAPVAQAEALAERIRAVAGSPHLWLAHAYVRYLGDLSGGQALAGIVARTLSIPGPAGLSFYRFPDLSSPSDFKESYRSGLDAAPLTPAEVDETVSEALASFQAHQAIFGALE